MNILREPLLHFTIAGAILFGGYEWLNRGGADLACPTSRSRSAKGRCAGFGRPSPVNGGGARPRRR